MRIVEKLEKDGAGLNLTWEVRDGILNHQTSLMPHTLEGKIVRLSDKIAYINSDFDDAIRAQLLCEDDIPLEIRKRFIILQKRMRYNHETIPPPLSAAMYSGGTACTAGAVSACRIWIRLLPT